MGYFKRAALLLEQAGCKQAALIYGILGNYDVQLGSSVEQEYWILKFYDSAEAQGDMYLMATASISQAFFNEIQGNLSEAEKRYRKVFALFMLLKDDKNISLTHCSLGNLYVRASIPGAARDEFTEALNIAIQLNIESLIADCYSGMGRVFYLENAFPSAKVWLEKALEL